MSALTVDERNRATSAQEVADFKANPPDRYFAYHAQRPNEALPTGPDIMGRRITTWMGDDLARVTWLGDAYRSGFGDVRQNFHALSIDGATSYSGTAYLSAGDYVRMRRVTR